jgi:hypothetical protein
MGTGPYSHRPPVRTATELHPGAALGGASPKRVLANVDSDWPLELVPPPTWRPSRPFMLAEAVDAPKPLPVGCVGRIPPWDCLAAKFALKLARVLANCCMEA